MLRLDRQDMNGLGDRFRRIVTAYLFAVVLRCVLLIEAERPVPLFRLMPSLELARFALVVRAPCADGRVRQRGQLHADGDTSVSDDVYRSFEKHMRKFALFLDSMPAFVVSSAVALKILSKVTFLCSQKENVLEVSVPTNGACYIIGDIHGAIHFLISVLQGTGLQSGNNHPEFMGDYVDRGPWRLEVLLIVSLLNICQPANVEVLRGYPKTSGFFGRHATA